MKVIPMAPNFTIDSDGKVYDSWLNVVPETIHDGKRWVTLITGSEWWEWDVAVLLMVATRYPLMHPDVYKHVVVPDYDANGPIPDFIKYSFDTYRVESKQFPGFYHIPMATRYVINDKQVLLSTMVGVVKAWHECVDKRRSNRFYHASAIRDDNRKRSHQYRHRAMALVFKAETWLDGLVVNHIDGDTRNDDPANLEWVTYSENMTHAVESGLRKSMKAVWLYDAATKETTKYLGIAEAARENTIGHNLTNIRTRTSNPYKYYGDQYYWLYESDYDAERLKTVRTSGASEVTTEGVELLAKHISKNEQFVVESMGAAAKLTGVPLSTIRKCIQTRQLRPYLGWMFKRLKDPREWPEFPVESHQALIGSGLRATPQRVQMRDGTVHYFKDPFEAAAFLRMHDITYRKVIGKSTLNSHGWCATNLFEWSTQEVTPV